MWRVLYFAQIGGKNDTWAANEGIKNSVKWFVNRTVLEVSCYFLVRFFVVLHRSK